MVLDDLTVRFFFGICSSYTHRSCSEGDVTACPDLAFSATELIRLRHGPQVGLWASQRCEMIV